MGDVPEMVLKVAKELSGAPFPSRRSIAHAQRVLASMREPTDQMALAGLQGLADNGLCDLGDSDARSCWTAMIDAALASQGNGRER